MVYQYISRPSWANKKLQELTDSQRFALLVIDEREERQLSRARFAKYFGVSAQAVGNWEQGNTIPQPDNLAKLAQMRGEPLEALMNVIYNKPQPEKQICSPKLTILDLAKNLSEDEKMEVAISILEDSRREYHKKFRKINALQEEKELEEQKAINLEQSTKSQRKDNSRSRKTIPDFN